MTPADDGCISMASPDRHDRLVPQDASVPRASEDMLGPTAASDELSWICLR